MLTEDEVKEVKQGFTELDDQILKDEISTN